MSTKAKRIFSLIILVVMIMNVTAFAVEARESRFISSTSGSVCALGGGTIEIEFTVTGTGPMNKIGAYTIVLYKADGTLVDSFAYTDTGYENMMGYNTFSYTSCIQYPGVSGQGYYAVITCYAENDNGFAKIPYITATETA